MNADAGAMLGNPVGMPTGNSMKNGTAPGVNVKGVGKPGGKSSATGFGLGYPCGCSTGDAGLLAFVLLAFSLGRRWPKAG
jgi:hypothetical protein